MPVARLLAAFVALLVIIPAATASASFDGSNGKVAYVDGSDDLYIDDPFDDQPAQGPLVRVASQTVESKALAPPSPPAWSPDGTLLAYTAPVDDSFGYKHSAVFVMKADGTERRQLSHPFALEPDTCDGQCDNGHHALDRQPTWTPDGKIAYIRMVNAGDESPHVGERGTSVRVVDPAGGGESTRYYLEPKANGLIFSFVWPVSSIHPFAIVGDKPDKNFAIRNLGTKTDIVSALGVLDLDASPVGQKLAYTTVLGGHTVHIVDFAGRELESFATGLEKPQVRFTPDGNSIVRTGCALDREQRRHCGLVAHRLADPDGDVRDDDPLETPFLDFAKLIRQPSLPGYRGNYDIQSQDLPVIYIPGFLGSEIQCDGSNVWMPALPPIVMQPIRLSADGRSNQTCLSAGATGKMVDSFLAKDVYGHADDWLEKMDPPGGHASFGWDWRKAPQDSLDELNAKIEELLAANELGVKQGAKRVTLIGHSYGGVLMRLFVDDIDRSRKVARMLTVGAPMWGSIKPFFPLTFGIEGIGTSALDAFVGNEDLKDSMRNFSGAYHLLADDNFGQWLTVDDAARNQAGVKAFLESVGGNGVLFEDGRKTHEDHVDGWLDYDGRIDVRAVVGVGLLTTRHVKVTQDAQEGDADVEVAFADGDITVPAHSAWQGEPGGATMGDPIHLQRRCSIEHMDQTKDQVVQLAYTQFLLFGRTPRKLPAPNCDPAGKLIEISEDVPIPAPVSTELAAAGADGPLNLGQADWTGKADVLDLPGGTKVVTNDSTPVSLTFASAGWTMTVTDLEGEARGRRVAYGPLTGDVVITPGATDVPAVSVDGKAVTPATDSGPPAGGGGGGGGGAVPAGGTTGTPQPSPVTLKASVRGGRVKLSKAGVARVAAKVDGGAATGTLTLTAKLGRRQVRIGSARVAMPAGRMVTANVRVTKAARRAARRGALRVVAALTVHGTAGGTAGARAALRLR